MGGGAFNWLKTEEIGPKSANQAEIHLADLQKILSIRLRAGRAGAVNQSLSLISRKNG
jgi:hypothetical protein